MFEKRQDVICRMAVVGAGRLGKAAARLTLTEQTPVRAIGRVERKLLAPALAGGITPSPGTRFDAGDGFASTEASTFTPEPETHGTAIPALAARGHRAPTPRRPDRVRLRRQIHGRGLLQAETEYGNCASRAGRTARRPKSHSGTIGCASISAARTQLFGPQITRDTFRYQEQSCQPYIRVREQPHRPPRMTTGRQRLAHR